MGVLAAREESPRSGSKKRENDTRNARPPSGNRTQVIQLRVGLANCYWWSLFDGKKDKLVPGERG